MLAQQFFWPILYIIRERGRSGCGLWLEQRNLNEQKRGFSVYQPKAKRISWLLLCVSSARTVPACLMELQEKRGLVSSNCNNYWSCGSGLLNKKHPTHTIFL